MQCVFIYYVNKASGKLAVFTGCKNHQQVVAAICKHLHGDRC